MSGSAAACGFRPGKLLICFVGRHKGERLVAVAKRAGARGGTIALGKTLADNRLLQAFSLADVQQDIVITLLGDEARTVIEAIKTAAPKKIAGLAVVLDVAGILLRGCGDLPSDMDAERDIMESGYKLITVIVNNGYAEDVMAVARKAGARGGTIFTARGTGTEEDVRFFGITLVPEKDVLMIVAVRDVTHSILSAISAMPVFSEPGGGIIYSMNVEEFITLGK